jgi:REP element-mobilizing transposase RayT
MLDSKWDDNPFPLAYLITFRCYGSWLHGDVRGAMDRQRNHRYGTPRIPPNYALRKSEQARLKQASVTLNAAHRELVEAAIREVCHYRNYRLLALNVRTNHVHVVVAAARKPESILVAFKAYTSRRLREAGLCSNEQPLWSRHGSTQYLWKSHQVESAIEYVINGQGEELWPLPDRERGNP